VRSSVKTLLLVLGVAALLLLGKGFPQLRAFLKLFLHPAGLVLLALLAFWIYRLRTRPARDQTRIIANPSSHDSTKRLPPPKAAHDSDHA